MTGTVEAVILPALIDTENLDDMTDEEILKQLALAGYSPRAAAYVLAALRGRGEPNID